jgi:hypothetical protein
MQRLVFWPLTFVLGAGLAVAQLPVELPDSFYDPAAARMGVQSDVLKQTYLFATGSGSISVLRHERPDAQSDWVIHKDEFTVSYHVTAICCREGGDDLFVAGMQDDGTSVIERWSFLLPPGRQSLRFAGSPPPIGNPLPIYSASIVISGGGSYVPPGTYSRYPDPRRRLLFSGTTGPFTAMEVDPEGRFLLTYNLQEAAIQVMALDASPLALTTAYASGTHPQLDQIASIEAREFDGEGRKYLLRRKYGHSFPRSQEVYGIISDPENDGLLNSLQFFDAASFSASPYGQWSDWRLLWIVP